MGDIILLQRVIVPIALATASSNAACVDVHGLAHIVREQRAVLFVSVVAMQWTMRRLRRIYNNIVKFL